MRLRPSPQAVLRSDGLVTIAHRSLTAHLTLTIARDRTFDLLRLVRRVSQGWRAEAEALRCLLYASDPYQTRQVQPGAVKVIQGIRAQDATQAGARHHVLDVSLCDALYRQAPVVDVHFQLPRRHVSTLCIVLLHVLTVS